MKSWLDCKRDFTALIDEQMAAYHQGDFDDYGSAEDMLERFASAVAVVERDACKQACSDTPVLVPGHHEYTALRVQAMMVDAIAKRSNDRFMQGGLEMLSKVFMICNSYESGYGHGLQNDGLDLSKTPHSDPELGEAYRVGYEAGNNAYKLLAQEVLRQRK